MHRPLDRLAVLVSGNGSNLQAIIDACAAEAIDAQVVVTISNRPEAFGLQRAQRAQIPTRVVHRAAREPRDTYDQRLADTLAPFRPDLVVLAGWMRILTSTFLNRFPDQVINLHPALPGELAGTHAIERAWREAQAGIRDHTGVMVHRVPDEGVDDGPVLATHTVPIHERDTLDQLTARVHAVEHHLLVDTLASLCHTPPATSPPETHHEPSK